MYFEKPTELQKLTIEITTDCNLKCPGCPRTIAIEKDNWTNKEISIEKFKSIINNIPNTRMVTLHGIGEPMLHSSFLQIVESAKNSNKFRMIKVTTNGVTRSPGFIKEAIQAGLDEVWISVDSFNQIIASQMRTGSNIKKLSRNIEDCISLKLPIRISNVVSRTNIYDLRHLFTALYKMGNPIVYCQEFQDFGNDYGMLSAKERTMVRQIFLELKEKFPDINLVSPQFTSPEGDLCTAPWLRQAISVEGYLTPCCTTFDPTHFAFSDLSKYSFSELWEGKELQKWLLDMHSNKIAMCNGCGLNPRLNKMNDQLMRSGKTGREVHYVGDLIV